MLAKLIMFQVWQYTKLSRKGLGGVETHLNQTSHHLEKMGCKVEIGVIPPKFDENQPVFIHVHGDLFPKRALIQQFRKKIVLPVCHGTSIKRMISCHEFLSFSAWRGSFRDFSLHLYSDAYIAVSSAVKQEVQKFLRVKKPCFIINNAADTSVFKPLEKISDNTTLIFVGRGWDKVKNVETLVKSLEIVGKTNSSFKLIAAPGFESDKSIHITSIGPTFGTDLFEKMKSCRGLILCSFYESDSIVLHEAKSMGLPVLVSDISELRLATQDYKNSFYFDPRNPEQMAKVILDFLKMKNLKPSPRPRDWSTVAEEYLKVYSLMKDSKS